MPPPGSPASAPRTARKPCRLKTCRRQQALHGLCTDHLRERYPADWARSQGIIGKVTPRLWTPPLRPLTRATTRGYEVIDFATTIGEPLLPWQEWVCIHALELLPDGTYRFRTVLVLVARQNGKSHLKRVITLWRMYIDGASNVLGTAQDVSRAREQWNIAQQTIAASADLAAEYDPPAIGKLRNVNGDEWFRIDNGARYIISASNGKAARGGSYDEANIDELREQHDWKAWSAISKTTGARPKGQLWAMSNQGDDDSVVLHQLRGNAGADAPTPQGHVVSASDPTLGLFEYSGPDGCKLDDWAAIAQANPGLGHVLSVASVISAQGTDPPNVYRTEVLCQAVDQLDGAVDYAAWKACADATGNMDALRDRVHASFDLAPDGQHATLATAAQMDDGRVRVEIAGAWKSEADAEAELEALVDRIKPQSFTWYSTGPAAGLNTVLRRLARKYNRRTKRQAGDPPEDGAITGMAVAEACQGLAAITKARRVVQADQALLNAHISGARKLPSGDGWRFIRRGPVGHVDAAYAAAAAVQHARTAPPARRPRVRSVG